MHRLRASRGSTRVRHFVFVNRQNRDAKGEKIAFLTSFTLQFSRTNVARRLFYRFHANLQIINVILPLFYRKTRRRGPSAHDTLEQLEKSSLRMSRVALARLSANFGFSHGSRRSLLFLTLVLLFK